MKIKKEQSSGLSSKMPGTSTKSAWISVGITATISAFLWLVGLKDLSVILFSALLILTGSALKIIKEPEIGFLWKSQSLCTILFLSCSNKDCHKWNPVWIYSSSRRAL